NQPGAAESAPAITPVSYSVPAPGGGLGIGLGRPLASRIAAQDSQGIDFDFRPAAPSSVQPPSFVRAQSADLPLQALPVGMPALDDKTPAPPPALKKAPGEFVPAMPSELVPSTPAKPERL